MIALATEVTVWLLASSVLCLIAGFALARSFARPSAGDPPRVITDDDDIKALIEELRQEQRSKDDEMASLRSQLDDLRRGPQPSPEVSSVTDEVVETLREQLDRLRSERDDRALELKTFREQNTSLQRRLNETADRLVEFERKRMQTRGEPVAEPDPLVAPDVAATPREPRAPLDPAVQREREREIAELPVERSSPLQVGNEPIEDVPPPAAIERTDDEEPEPAPAPEPGAERPLTEIATIPRDVIERLDLVGVKTNLQLLKKAGPRARRNGLATSMRLQPEEVLAFVHRADLLRVGMRHEDVVLLDDAGVRSLNALASAKADPLNNRLQSIGNRGAGREGTVTAETVQRWIDTAASLPDMVEA